MPRINFRQIETRHFTAEGIAEFQNMWREVIDNINALQGANGPIKLAADRTVELDRNQSNYLGNVLRRAAGETVLVFNGRDGEWQAVIAGRKRPDGLNIESQTR